MSRPLAVVGFVKSVHPIDGADLIQRAVVDCGDSGTWSGVVGRDIEAMCHVTVFLQDALLPPDERWAFMEKHKWRVRMCRFKGVPSECVIIRGAPLLPCGTDLTAALGVTKYEKPIPAGAAADIAANFPSWIPRTDEDNFQRVPELVERMAREPWYATEKADGTSCTVWNDADGMHVCSRNYELKEFTESGGTNLYWRVAREQGLERIPDLFAIQFEIVGPGVQGNPMGLKQNEIRVFNLYDRERREMCARLELNAWCDQLGLKPARLIMDAYQTEPGQVTADDLQKLAEIKYENGKHGEGIVIRDVMSTWSFKVINLLYRD